MVGTSLAGFPKSSQHRGLPPETATSPLTGRYIILIRQQARGCGETVRDRGVIVVEAAARSLDRTPCRAFVSVRTGARRRVRRPLRK
jgi:hypothetical protein